MHGARFDPARSRGRAAGDRRGTGPRAQFSPGPARPDPSGRHLPSSSLSQPDPGLARGHRADRRRRPETFYQAHYRPDGAVLVVVGDVEPERGPRPDRRPLRGRAGGRVAACRGRTVVEPRQSGRRDFVLVRAGVGGAGPPRLAHRAAGPSRRAGSRRPRRPALLRPAVAALAVPGRDRQDGHLGRGRPRRGAPRRPVLHPARGRSGRRPSRPSSGGSPPSCSACADTGRRPTSWPDRGAGSRRPGAGNRKT